ncbi:MAG: Eco57I restriction-modification methylase domain-containing protein [Opitutaceae bacterium]|jgi:hypothetical protein
MALPAEIAALIETFAANEADYTAPEFKEAQVRQQFIDPFFAALGWDVANTAGYAEAYKEVIHEDAIKIGGETKAPDYSFRIGGNRKFFVEAKKPSVSLKDNPEPAFQLRRYSWTVKLPLGILTDFQEFAIYDTRVKPVASDKTSVARLFYCRYDELEKHWDFIVDTFSKEAVLKGSFDKYAAATKGKRGSITVDEAFLKEIENWRDLLARNLALRNPALDTRGLNFAVQRTIDRIVFLRIAEDRGNEPFGQLQALLGALSAKDNDDTLDEDPAAYGGGGKPKRPPTIYPRLVQIFEKADYRYNSGLFHFAKDTDCAETPDTLTPGLHIDDAVLKEILGSLYYPKSSYAFGYLPAYILGHVYEQFLGKVIRLTDGHQAKVEEKPEVRKAGGVYYTPQYIVDYIVQKTVGPLVDGKTPKQLETLAVLDPACGSGTFLLGAYDYLLKWYLDYYSANTPEKWAKQARLYETAPNAHVALTAGQGPKPTTPARSWSLTTAERKRILLAHIHGVDIDSQAVEVTKLSLLLKVLEGERREFQGRTREMSAVLPDLSQNIRCGNSLIGHDFYQQPDLPTLDAEAKYKLNTFEWKDGFPEVMKRGGFDAVIGNPPYIRIQTMLETSPDSVGYLSKLYKSAAAGNYDIYVCFVERALALLNKHGLTGYILPHKFFNAQYGQPLRELAAAGKNLREIIHFGHQQIFAGATTYTCLLFLQKAPAKTFQYQTIEDLDAWRQGAAAPAGEVSATKATSDDWVFVAGSGGALLDRLCAIPTKLEDVTTRIFQGLKTSADKIYILEEKSRNKSLVTAYSPQLEKDVVLEASLLHPLIKGGDSRRYCLSRTNRLILFPYAPDTSGNTKLIDAAKLSANYPKTWAYLNANKAYLEAREDERFKGPAWYQFGRGQALDVMPLPKVFTPDIAPLPAFSYDDKGDAFFTGGVSGGYGLLFKPGINPKVILALLNSRILGWIIAQTATQMRGGYYSFEARFIRSLPIIKPDKKTSDKILSAVDTLISLHRVQAATQTPHEKDALANQITATDRQIDALVYQLYGLTPEEIALVEKTTSKAVTHDE